MIRANKYFTDFELTSAWWQKTAKTGKKLSFFFFGSNSSCFAHKHTNLFLLTFAFLKKGQEQEQNSTQLNCERATSNEPTRTPSHTHTPTHTHKKIK